MFPSFLNFSSHIVPTLPAIIPDTPFPSFSPVIFFLAFPFLSTLPLIPPHVFSSFSHSFFKTFPPSPPPLSFCPTLSFPLCSFPSYPIYVYFPVNPSFPFPFPPLLSFTSSLCISFPPSFSSSDPCGSADVSVSVREPSGASEGQMEVRGLLNTIAQALRCERKSHEDSEALIQKWVFH